jgi:mannose-6-phosphate isomerase
LKSGIDRNGLLLAAETGNITEVLHYENAEPGDIFYTPAGQVHAIGPGILLAEIQQTSDITYRIYDWDRKDQHGNSRELHLKEALDAIDYSPIDDVKTKYKPGKNKTIPLVNSEYFNTSLIWLTQGLKKDYSILDAFIVLLAVEGEGWIDSAGEKYPLRKGEVILLPATIAETSIFALGTLKLLEITV